VNECEALDARTLAMPVTTTLSVDPMRLPPLPRHGERADGLSPAQRRVMVAAILAAHVAVVYGLLQVREVREAAHELAPMFVDLIAPPAPPAPRVPPPLPVPQPIRKPPLPAPLIAAAASPAPAPFLVPAVPEPEPEPEPEPVQAIAPPAPAAVQAPAAPPAPPPAPKIIPASAVQYLEPPAPEYPRLSRRHAEAGRVTLRVYVDTAGAPRNVQIATSSGFARLDDAALAAMQSARFKPYTENGQPTAGWTLVPIDFELEK
jgi:protein TonB